MLALMIAMGVPLFAIIGYALFQPNPAAAEMSDKPAEQPAEYIAPMAF